ncbi:hypothetical protein COW36_23950 [bacterium (Candidatus Blackallbacteria) CG17_big_fil_post_rev_8_21_14_2_50_48_46]|uniref:Phosphatidate phosphatase APP1 catalytic domain-containing protein n=1 Tax=bacterium (Candidatus Blackallbacteria) CG17_big_fil_post_rev_8_21_14_2_50_48_46 TaxID=2014261 RepID=A0A2M7FWU6_9BACT|nr:MAG: hypothetical protein COW64_18890 [bacterium (Candidatus Blackallbacteria) CG18_big_fil_WC_8_21_14_2_50_49_26]PIW13727.1 MAG: hypothetical protein COW36_23950 [bacterium (Candidatus Blackallbacteria) CG17_big_fil_post_rev_8_21_14_2_50_48_46]PIW44953.1 MAG: hypothetical protein COW20_21580 [bacterium (Candidatus Blackallbacteria) CG13_big_fil_rev_8_21_14_2_50_49_14]
MKRSIIPLSLPLLLSLLTACGKTQPVGVIDTAPLAVQQIESLERAVDHLNTSLSQIEKKSPTGVKATESMNLSQPELPESDPLLQAAASSLPLETQSETETLLPRLDAEAPLEELPTAQALSDTATEGTESTRTRKEKQLQIDVYDGYGTTAKLTVSGRLFSDRRLDAVEEKDSRLKNLVKTSRRFVLNEAEQVWLTVSLGSEIREVLTNDEGFFEVNFEHIEDLPLGLHAAKVSLSARNIKRYQAQPSQGKFILHNPDSNRLGIISDVDDTILQTNATSKMRMLKTIFLSNYKTQLPVAGMSDLFRAIHHGPEGDGYDATHYVSSSPDNLYSRINLFLDYRNFPEGSIDLKNVGLGKDNDSLFDHEIYKTGKIRRILETYPQRRFILFGDSGERDPEIYRQIAQEFPQQIVAVYIHNVTEEDPFSSRFQGQMLFTEPDKVKKDLLSRGLIYPY